MPSELGHQPSMVLSKMKVEERIGYTQLRVRNYRKGRAKGCSAPGMNIPGFKCLD